MSFKMARVHVFHTEVKDEPGGIAARLKPLGEAKDAALRLYVGDYEARAVPVADTDPATELGDTVTMTPGVYDFVVAGDGFGHRRLKFVVVGGVTLPLPLPLTRNHASASAGAAATGDGVKEPLNRRSTIDINF